MIRRLLLQLQVLILVCSCIGSDIDKFQYGETWKVSVPIKISKEDDLNDERAVVLPGHRVRGYELIERTASLGVCEHDSSVILSPLSNNGREITVPWYNTAEEGPTLEYQCLLDDIDLVFVNENYRLKKKFNGGSHGEIWRASKVDSSDETFILKRIFVEKGQDMIQSGLREIHFGTLLDSEPHVARFVEYFYHPNGNLQELWLVFHDEGKSLRQYLYSKQKVGRSVMFETSKFWQRLRTTEDGGKVTREIIRQILQGIAVLHEKGITHRDIKPSNILVNKNTYPVAAVKLADFGSAVDGYTLKELYDAGPSQAEETREYQPPEVLFGHDILAYDRGNPSSYDIWSLGIVFLEVLLGSPEVFKLSPRAKASLDQRLRDKPEAVKRKSYLLHAMAEYCIYRPNNMRASHEQYALVPQPCNLGQFNTTLRDRDPLRKGLQDQWGVHLLWQMLQWSPENRISAKDALQHAYFTGPYVCPDTQREFATAEELSKHNAYLRAQSRLKEKRASVVPHRDLPHEFTCPGCSRTFDEWISCDTHLHARRHDSDSFFCQYNIESLALSHENDISAPDSFNAHFGYFQLAGRRSYMEDMYFVHQDTDFSVYAIFDGHLGLETVSFLRAHLLQIALPYINKLQTYNQETGGTTRYHLYEEFIFRELFQELHEQYLSQADLEHDFSGSTVTLMVRFATYFIIANVGDSTAHLLYKTGAIDILSTDHWPNVPSERARIEASGGFIEKIGVWRVMGQLGISRSIGDHHLRQYVSVVPSIQHVTLSDQHDIVIIASDGIWETLNAQTISRLIQEQRPLNYDTLSDYETAKTLHDMATSITFEAYVRGSTDNMAVLLIDMGHRIL